ncbi:MAG: hypothetical protein HN742_13080 [Lentisphaerae bacterium]|nr:hypothetical protein [Lentisphaerota bacterium]MBT5607877.1 hypothetical protein [Lentisphaerota bacterium]MBT7058268.1 hypothetical protein [Lentisphaerota bacterium]MBT7842804.1 hypothetical protein [Lentisphaerota bacterium]
MATRATTPAKTPPARPGPAWRRAAEYGIDMSLLEENLRKTPEQRLEAHAAALALVAQLRQAGGQHGPES